MVNKAGLKRKQMCDLDYVIHTKRNSNQNMANYQAQVENTALHLFHWNQVPQCWQDDVNKIQTLWHQTIDC